MILRRFVSIAFLGMGALLGSKTLAEVFGGWYPDAVDSGSTAVVFILFGAILWREVAR